MRKLLLICAVAALVLPLSCSKNKSDSGLVETTFSYEDLQDAWRGTLPTWRVDNTDVDRPSYTLENVDFSLIFDTQTYWLQMTYFSDSLEYQYYNRGYWLWDPYYPDVMIFEMYLESSTQIFNPLRPGPGPDSTGTGTGGGTGGGTAEPPDTVMMVKGDNTMMEERFISALEYKVDQIRLYDFVEYLDLGDITLDRF